MSKTVGMIALGCAKNRVDSENMLGMLKTAGYTIVNKAELADIVIINTCGFIESAKEEAISVIAEYAQRKNETGKPKTLIATGCLIQRYAKELQEGFPEVDAFMGVSEYGKLLAVIKEAEDGKRPVYTQMKHDFLETPRVLTTPSWSAYVKISDGCDNRCTYCAIPLIRGGYRSRAYADIVNESRTLAESGATELTLIAQDTSRYGNDFGERKTLLSSLLRDISAIDAVHWLRVLYCYPDTSNEELLDTIAALPKVCKYLDLPLQHINAKMLKDMNRRGTPELIREVIKMCRDRDIAIRTTFIVGFPGETEEQFTELLDFIKEAQFDRLGAFTYSPEDGTKAAEMPGQLAEEIKQDRYARLMTLQQGISKKIQRKRLGTVCEVLCEGTDKKGRYIGRSMLEAPDVDGKIRFTSDRVITPGEYVSVRVQAAKAYDLIGEEVK